MGEQLRRRRDRAGKLTGVAPRKLGTACVQASRPAQSSPRRLQYTDVRGGGDNGGSTRRPLRPARSPVQRRQQLRPGDRARRRVRASRRNGRSTCVGDSGGPVYLDTHLRRRRDRRRVARARRHHEPVRRRRLSTSAPTRSRRGSSHRRPGASRRGHLRRGGSARRRRWRRGRRHRRLLHRRRRRICTARPHSRARTRRHAAVAARRRKADHAPLPRTGVPRRSGAPRRRRIGVAWARAVVADPHVVAFLQASGRSRGAGRGSPRATPYRIEQAEGDARRNPARSRSRSWAPGFRSSGGGNSSSRARGADFAVVRLLRGRTSSVRRRSRSARATAISCSELPCRGVWRSAALPAPPSSATSSWPGPPAPASPDAARAFAALGASPCRAVLARRALAQPLPVATLTRRAPPQSALLGRLQDRRERIGRTEAARARRRRRAEIVVVARSQEAPGRGYRQRICARLFARIAATRGSCRASAGSGPRSPPLIAHPSHGDRLDLPASAERVRRPPAPPRWPESSCRVIASTSGVGASPGRSRAGGAKPTSSPPARLTARLLPSRASFPARGDTTRPHGHEDQGEEPRRRDGRGRDDPHHLEVHQGQADPARTSTSTSNYFDLGDRAPRRHRRPASPSTSANAVKQYGVGVKCATITPDEARVAEFKLKEMWTSPNGTIRNLLGGMIFREPIICRNVPRLVPSWTKPIVIGRHALRRPVPRHRLRRPRRRHADPAVHAQGRRRAHRAQGVRLPRAAASRSAMYNLDEPDRRLRAQASLQLRPPARLARLPLDEEHDPRRRYDGRFKDLFQKVFDEEFAAAFTAGEPRPYEHRLIDDMVASAMKWDGGFVWACKNYDGDVQSGLGRPGLRLARPHDLGAAHARRQDRRGRGRARHRDAPLPRAPEGRAHVHEPHRLDLRVDAGPALPRQVRRDAGRRPLRRTRSSRSASRPSRPAR